MKDNYIDISGIAQVEKFPKIPRNYQFSEMCETYNFHIPKGKPNIHRILKLFIDTSIKEIKIVDAPCGKRTVIEGMLHIKVFYSADIYSNKIYFVHIDVPIYTFLALEKTIDVNILIEDAVIHKLDSRNISISCLLFVYPKLEEIDFDEQCNIDKDEYDMDKGKNQSRDINHYNKENATNMDFGSFGELEFDIEYDMNSHISYDGNFEDEKEDC
jgi:hypothetical protein